MNAKQSLALAIPLLFVASGSATAEHPPSAPKFLQIWAAAWQFGDVDKMMAFYDTAKETTAVESLGHVRKGPAEIRKMYQRAFDELLFDRVTLTPIAQGQHGPVAWATCRYKADMRLKSDNSRYILEVRGSFVMKREGETWKITLEHFSTIPDVPRVRAAEK